MVQPRHIQLLVMGAPVHMVLATVRQLQAVMEVVHRHMVVVLMVDMVQLAINKLHRGRLAEVCLTMLTVSSDVSDM